MSFEVALKQWQPLRKASPRKYNLTRRLRRCVFDKALLEDMQVDRGSRFGQLTCNCPGSGGGNLGQYESRYGETQGPPHHHVLSNRCYSRGRRQQGDACEAP